MKRFKRIWAVLVMIAMLASLTACGGKDNDDANASAALTAAPEATEAPEPTAAEAPEATEAPEPTAAEALEATEAPEPTAAETPEPTEEAGTEAYTVTLPDGTELTFEGVPQKIVSMGPNITEILYAVGAGDKVAGRTNYCNYPEEALSVESVGSISKPDVEKIVELQPDVVIGSTHFSEETEQQLKDLGIQVAVLYNSTDMNGVYDIIRAVGRIAGCSDAAEALAAETKDKIDAVTAAAAQAETKPSVYYVVGYGEYGDYTAGGDTFIGQMIAAAGGNNIAADVSGWSYTLEALLEADPEIIIVGLGEAEGFKTAENYSELSAVKNDKVYEIDRNLLDRQGYRNAEGMQALAEILQPGVIGE